VKLSIWLLLVAVVVAVIMAVGLRMAEAAEPVGLGQEV
jgi:hypothetical protein